MGRDPGLQRARQERGNYYEKMAVQLLKNDKKLKGWTVGSTLKTGEAGIDIWLEPPGGCSVNPRKPNCREAFKIEVKSVEKLFESDRDPRARPWYNRLSRFVLKMSELEERPPCYMFITHDDLAGRTVIDAVDSRKVLAFLASIRKTPMSPKLPVRALLGSSGLRNTPCPFVSAKKGEPYFSVKSKGRT